MQDLLNCPLTNFSRFMNAEYNNSEYKFRSFVHVEYILHIYPDPIVVLTTIWDCAKPTSARCVVAGEDGRAIGSTP